MALKLLLKFTCWCMRYRFLYNVRLCEFFAKNHLVKRITCHSISKLANYLFLSSNYVFKNWINIFSRRGSEMFWLGRLWNIVSMIIEWLILFATSISYAINYYRIFLPEIGQMCEGNILYLNLSLFFSAELAFGVCDIIIYSFLFQTNALSGKAQSVLNTPETLSKQVIQNMRSRRESKFEE